MRVRLIAAGAIALVLYLTIGYLIPGFTADASCFYSWGKHGFSSETLQVYDDWKSVEAFIYPPLGIYFCVIISRLSMLFPFEYGSNGFFLTLKLIPTLFAFLCAWIGYRIYLRKTNARAAFSASAALLFSPALITCTALWGQWDSILIFGILACIWALIYQRETLIPIAVALTALVKPHIVFSLPAIAAAGFIGDRKKLIIGTASAAIAAAAIILPFQIAGGSDWFWSYLNAGSSQKSITMNAYNFWQLMHFFDLKLHFGITYPAAYAIGASAWLLSAVVVAWKIMKQRCWKTVILATCAITLASFVFLTNMHERYIVPAAVLSAMLLPFGRIYKYTYAALSLTATLNMLAVYLQVYHNFALPYKQQLYASALISLINVCCLAVYFLNLIQEKAAEEQP